MPTRPPQAKHSEQNILNDSFDEDFGVLTHESLEYDGQNLQRAISGNTALKVTVSGSITYLGIAPPGSSQASSVWQCSKIDQTSGTVITWADGNSNFDNTASDLTALTYS